LFGSLKGARGAWTHLAGDKFAVGDREIEVREQQGMPGITVRWASSPPWSDETRREMAATVDPYLTAFTLRTGEPLEVEWTSANYVDAAGVLRFTAWHEVRVQASSGRDSYGPLSGFGALAGAIAGHPELISAVQHWRGARALRIDDPSASMAQSYLAIEGLVTAVLGGALGSRTSAADWRKAAPSLGVAAELMERLYLSTQLGRHVDPRHAKRELTRDGWAAMGDVNCCKAALDVLVAYSGTL